MGDASCQPDPGGRGTSDTTDPDGTGRDETPTERADRNWDELLQELRVTQTGIQILSGFLLTLPFQQRFADLEPWLKSTYLVAVALATISTSLVIAPVASHRLLFRRHRKMTLVGAADRMAKAGLVTLGLTVGAVVMLVFGFIAGSGWGVIAGAVALAFFTVQWLVLPLTTLRHRREDPP
jgi:O-antigen/teichoic acid export membrane protein